jgi:hypothetical protein
MTAAIATTGPNPGIPDGVLVGVAVAVVVGVGGSGVAVGVGVGVIATETETTKIENPGVSARSVSCSEPALTTSVDSS